MNGLPGLHGHSPHLTNYAELTEKLAGLEGLRLTDELENMAVQFSVLFVNAWVAWLGMGSSTYQRDKLVQVIQNRLLWVERIVRLKAHGLPMDFRGPGLDRVFYELRKEAGEHSSILAVIPVAIYVPSKEMLWACQLACSRLTGEPPIGVHLQ